MRAKDKLLLRSVKKRSRLPYHGKVAGAAARHRPDRRAAGGDVQPLPANQPAAPAGGAVRQKFQAGGAVDEAKEPVRRARGFNAPRPPWTNYEQEFTRHPSKEWGYAGTGKRATDTEEEPEKRQAGGMVPKPPPKPRPASGNYDIMEPEKRRRGGLVAAAESIRRRGTEGSLHKAMGIPEGQKIGPGRLASEKAKAKRTGNTKLMRKVVFAQNINK
jgi:hypothetical protein